MKRNIVLIIMAITVLLLGFFCFSNIGTITIIGHNIVINKKFITISSQVLAILYFLYYLVQLKIGEENDDKALIIVVFIMGTIGYWNFIDFHLNKYFEIPFIMGISGVTILSIYWVKYIVLEFISLFRGLRKL